MFSQKSKIQTVGNIKKLFLVFSFQKFLIFHICVFSRKCSMFHRGFPLRNVLKLIFHFTFLALFCFNLCIENFLTIILKVVSRLKTENLWRFLQKSPSWMFDGVVNAPLRWCILSKILYRKPYIISLILWNLKVVYLKSYSQLQWNLARW